MSRLRAFAVLSALTAITLPMIPVQWVALRIPGELKRRLPVVWHRM
ncbi:MAG: 1-acyl-sn-glycerol-3-phosphate acyltransferase, partial [Alphaproteobacteria bacterium]|nr:1-acyl-sn-glycerol-3-phosphate acyltransferase [Alphaproteobacteria bacterium]